jgi:hypothetical protein
VFHPNTPEVRAALNCGRFLRRDTFAFQVCQQQTHLSVHATFSIETQRVNGDGMNRAAKNSRDVLLRVTAAKQILHLQFTRSRLPTPARGGTRDYGLLARACYMRIPGMETS